MLLLPSTISGGIRTTLRSSAASLSPSPSTRSIRASPSHGCLGRPMHAEHAPPHQIWSEYAEPGSVPQFLHRDDGSDGHLQQAHHRYIQGHLDSLHRWRVLGSGWVFTITGMLHYMVNDVTSGWQEEDVDSLSMKLEQRMRPHSFLRRLWRKLFG